MNIDNFPLDLQRIFKITHIHELAAKSSQADQMLNNFYDIMMQTAEVTGVKLSKLMPQADGDGYVHSVLDLDTPGKD